MTIQDAQFKQLAVQARKCMRLATSIGMFFLIIPAVIVWIALYIGQVTLPFFAHLLFAGWILIWLLYLLIAPAIRYRRYRYLIDQEKIVVREGLWFITEQFAPIERIHQIAVKSGPIDRLYGLSKVVATTAGGMVTISFLETSVAEDIADSLQSKVRYILAQQGISLNMPQAEEERADA